MSLLTFFCTFVVEKQQKITINHENDEIFTDDYNGSIINGM